LRQNIGNVLVPARNIMKSGSGTEHRQV